MKPYNVYQHPTLGYVAVKQGFSWPGLFFSFIWAATKRLWVQAILIFLAFVMIRFFASVIGQAIASTEQAGAAGASAVPILALASVVPLLIRLAVIIFIGMKGNSWREKNVLTRGYRFRQQLMAQSPDQAIAMIASGPRLANPPNAWSQ